MRLLNTSDLRITEFYGTNIPRYAALSHTWGSEEISHQEWTELTTRSISTSPEKLDLLEETITSKEGYAKILAATRLASAASLEWLWVDTICIDKTSSAELTEAINSMYAWYHHAVVCYAFLGDVPAMTEDHPEFESKIAGSRWFTRGWTLQELIGPRTVDFYSQSWTRLGNKSEGRFPEIIAKTTGIDVSYLIGATPLSVASVAKKMFWLSRRKTTRTEDMAYCMLGIFNINMPLLYGEGQRAFARLQEEIIRSHYDHTIFCWTREEAFPTNWVSMLAPWPSAFRESGHYVRKSMTRDSTPYSMTNLGLSINLPIIHNYEGFFGVLDAGIGGGNTNVRACISLRSGEDDEDPDEEDTIRYYRQGWPKYPLGLDVGPIWTLPRKSLYVQTRPIVTRSGLEVVYIRKSTLRFGAGPYFIFRTPTECQLVGGIGHSSTASESQRLTLRDDDVEVYPEGEFDAATGFLSLKSPRSKDRYQSAVVRLISDAPGATLDAYYFYIASCRDSDMWFFHLTSDAELRMMTEYANLDPHDRMRRVFDYLEKEAMRYREDEQMHKEGSKRYRNEEHMYRRHRITPRRTRYGDWLFVPGRPFQTSIINLRRLHLLSGAMEEYPPVLVMGNRE